MYVVTDLRHNTLRRTDKPDRQVELGSIEKQLQLNDQRGALTRELQISNPDLKSSVGFCFE